MRLVFRRIFLLLCLIVGNQIGILHGQDIPAPTNKLINDYANALNAQQEQRLEKKLVDYHDSTSIQIAVVTIESTGQYDIFEYSYKWAKEWGIGEGEKDNGVLLFVALRDRKLRIQTGYGSEGFLTDAMSRRIIEQALVPAFRRNDYYGGIDHATKWIMQLGTGEYINDSNRNSFFNDTPIDKRVIIILILILILCVVFIAVWCKRTGKCNERDGGGYYDGGRYNYPHGGGWFGGSSGGGFGGGGFGGGGFGGFGGGGFGGGGAGGGW